MILKRTGLALLLLFTALISNAFEIPELSRPVMDEAGLLNGAQVRRLEDSLYELRRAQAVQLQVYVIRSLQGESIEGAAIKIFDKWKLGEAKTDKGLLFLIAPNEKRMRIEVGQGLEGDIPDVVAKRIISDVVKPYFQRGEFATGIMQGVSSIENYIGQNDPSLQGNQEQQAENPHDRKSGGGWIILIVIGIWFLIFLFNPSLALYILFSGFGGGGGRGGGGWSGGGGSSSGGGASGDW